MTHDEEANASVHEAQAKVLGLGLRSGKHVKVDGQNGYRCQQIAPRSIGLDGHFEDSTIEDVSVRCGEALGELDHFRAVTLDLSLNGQYEQACHEHDGHNDLVDMSSQNGANEHGRNDADEIVD